MILAAYLNGLMLLTMMIKSCIEDISERVDRSPCIRVSQEQVGRGVTLCNPLVRHARCDSHWKKWIPGLRGCSNLVTDENGSCGSAMMEEAGGAKQATSGLVRACVCGMLTGDSAECGRR